MRECPDGTGHIFLRRAEKDRTVLPRRHPGVRSVRTQCAPERAYGTLPTWRSRWHWLNIVVMLAVDARPEALTKRGVSLETFRSWAKAESLYAEKATGRRLIVRPLTVASLMEVSERTVQRCRAAARELGLLVDVVHGRMLSVEECFKAREQGSPQRGMANESAMATPAWLGLTAWRRCAPVEDVTPTSGRTRFAERLAVDHGSPRRAKAKNAAPSSRQHQRKQTEPRNPILDPQKWALRALTTALAVELVSQVPFLRNEQPGRLKPILSRFVTGPLPWTVADVLEHIARTDARRQMPAFTADRITTRPAVVLAGYLRDIDPQADHPRLDIIVDAERADARRENHHAQIEDVVEVEHSPARPVRPRWCGTCHPQSRHIELNGGDTAARCPRCHPLTQPRPVEDPPF